VVVPVLPSAGPTPKKVSSLTNSGENENREISKGGGSPPPVFLGPHPHSSEKMETGSLDPETCYDSDYERLVRPIVDKDTRRVSGSDYTAWNQLVVKQDDELLRLFSRSLFPVNVGNFTQVLRGPLCSKFITPNRVNLIVKTCVQLKIPPEDFKQTVRGVRNELTPTGFPKLRSKLSNILHSWPTV